MRMWVNRGRWSRVAPGARWVPCVRVRRGVLVGMWRVSVDWCGAWVDVHVLRAARKLGGA
jgi:hypothetical protein